MMTYIKWSIFFLCISTLSTFALVEEHLKTIPDKSMHQGIRNIDFIYLINLDERPEKWQSSLEQLLPYHIEPYRFSAVNGWKLSFDVLNDIGVKYEVGMKQDLWGTCYFPDGYGKPHHEVIHVFGRNYFSHCMTRGAIGIVMSHLSILKDAIDSDYETIWVMEDDVQVIQDPNRLSDLIERLDRKVGKEGWDVLFTDRDTKDRNGNYVHCYGYAPRPNFSPKDPSRLYQNKWISRDFRRIGARYGAYSMIIRRSGMKKIYNFIVQHGVFLPYDMEFTLPDDIRLYSLNEDVVSTLPDAISDNGSPNYENTY